MNGKRRWLFTCLLLPVLVITGCGFLRNAEKIATAPDPVVVGQDAGTETESDAAEQKVKEEEQQLISELQIPEEPGDMQAVSQCVVDEQRHRKGGAAIHRNVLSPADAGVAVVGVHRRMLQLGVVQPRQAGYEEEGPCVTVLRESAALQHLLLAALAQGDEIVIGQVALHRAVDVHAVRLHGGVGGRTPVELRHRAAFEDAAAQLGYGVGGPGHRIEKAEEEGQCH